MTGTVTLVGAGPGDKGLLTTAGAQAIARADAVVYDRLVGEDILDLIPKHAEKVCVGKENHHHPVPQEQINDILVRLACEGKNVVRLKGGDCFLFGRGGEECEHLLANNVPFRVIPGVTSALAAPAFAGIPVTHRDFTSSVHIITAHARVGKSLKIDFDSLVRLDGTLVFLMGLTALERVTDGLLRAGMQSDMPAAVIENGARGTQRKVVTKLADLAGAVRQAGLQSPALIVVGRVCGLSDALDWFTPLPLHGKTIVVTRPKTRAGTLAARLRALGANVIEAPCIETVEREDTQPLAAALEQSYDWAVFTSPAGVPAAVHALRRLGRDLRALYNMKLAAIGKGTADALAACGLTADLLPAQYDGEHLADALIGAMPQGGSALLLRAAQGGQMLPERLSAAGIRVTDVPLYDTVHRCDKADTLRSRLTAGKVDGVTFTSVSTVEGFAEAIGADCTGVTAFCIGKQTADAAKQHYNNVKIAKNATIDDLVACIKEEI
ncbi:uroporphyrinogen-III C-methyltransferase [Candidatus Agathobaculum pullicola]|uniref:uroporphyrinogen-III C-methyltransferase n=1 Tax=Candidatus Agathobaculum pullicola TaxID=2838426 RepID=UPI003F93C9D0